MDYHKFNVIILLICVSCEAHDELKLVSKSEPVWRNILKLTTSNQTIFIDIDNDGSLIFKSSVIKSIYQYQSVVVVVGIDIIEDLNFCKKLKTVLDRDHDIVLITKSLDPKILEIPLLVFMLKPYWSAFFIIVTTKDRLYNCDEEKLNQAAMDHIENFLNILWHEYRTINVFLNLPYVCPNKYIVYNTTKITDAILYNRTIQLVQTDEQISETMSKKRRKMLTRNYPLRGNIFYRFPTAIKNCSGTDIYIKTSEKYSGGFCGLDGLVMTDIMTHFGFNLSLPTLSPGYDKYGYQTDKGVVTGSLGHIVNKSVDVSFNSRFMVKYITGTEQYVYLYYVADDALCPVLKQPEEEPLWQYPINAYTVPQWLFIIISFTSIGILMWIFARIKREIHNTNTSASSLLSHVLNSVNAGLFGFFLNRRKDLLVLRISCLFASLIILAEYQSYINYIFTTRVRFDMLNSLSDLVEQGTVIQTSPSIYNLINESINDVDLALVSRTLVLTDTDSFDYVFNHPNTATLERKNDAIMLTLMKYSDEAHRPLLYVLNECFRDLHLSYIASEEFPFVDLVEVFMMRLAESGLAKMYYTWTSRALKLAVTLPNLYSEPRPVGKISIAEQVIAFGVLLVGYGVSVVAFVVEMWLDRRKMYPFVP